MTIVIFRNLLLSLLVKDFLKYSHHLLMHRQEYSDTFPYVLPLCMVLQKWISFCFIVKKSLWRATGSCCWIGLAPSTSAVSLSLFVGTSTVPVVALRLSGYSIQHCAGPDSPWWIVSSARQWVDGHNRTIALTVFVIREDNCWSASLKELPRCRRNCWSCSLWGKTIVAAPSLMSTRLLVPVQYGSLLCWQGSFFSAGNAPYS